MELAQKLKYDASYDTRKEASIEIQRLRAKLAAIESIDRERPEGVVRERLRTATMLLSRCEAGFSAFMFGRREKKAARDKLLREIASFLDA